MTFWKTGIGMQKEEQMQEKKLIYKNLAGTKDEEWEMLSLAIGI